MQNLMDNDGREYPTSEKLLGWQKMHLSKTASGYGGKIPTSYVIRDGKKTKRVYCTIWSNSGSCWFFRNGEKVFLR
jgi:hypothetical protein